VSTQVFEPETADGQGVSSPSLDTHKHPAPRLGSPPDSEWEYAYRQSVSDELDILWQTSKAWPARAKALRDCGLAGVLLACKECGTCHLVPYRCAARTCPTCSRRLAAEISTRVAARVAVHDLIMENEPWDGVGPWQRRGWKHLVLTSRAIPDREGRFDPDVLRPRTRQVRAAVSPFWRLTPWGQQKRDRPHKSKRSRRDTSYIVGVEIAPGGMVHVHMLVFGEFVPQPILQDCWSQALGEKAHVRINAVQDCSGIGKAIRETLKYATKGEKTARDQARHAAAVEVAFRNLKRISVGGVLRTITVDEADSAHDDGKPEDVHALTDLLCLCCGAAGPWAWGGAVSPELVIANGGYGGLVE